MSVLLNAPNVLAFAEILGGLVKRGHEDSRPYLEKMNEAIALLEEVEGYARHIATVSTIDNLSKEMNNDTPK